jgi:hypothetical protein
MEFHAREHSGLTLAGGGVLVFVLGSVRHSRFVQLAGLGAAVTGGGLYARAWLARRGEKIEAAGEHIRSELDDLDPVARAQVLADVAKSQI